MKTKKLFLVISILITVTVLSPLNISLIKFKAAGTLGTVLGDLKKNDAKQHVIPILAYHSINDVPIGLDYLSVRSCDFESQIKYLMENGYTPLYVDQLDIADYYQKPIIITFDDGYQDNYLVAYQILKQYGFKATIFIIVNNINRVGFLTDTQIQEMSDLISFQCHTASHCDLYKTSEKDYYNEYIASKTNLEAITNKPVYALSYPFNKYNDKVIRLLSQHYNYALTTNPGLYSKNDGAYRMKRISVRRSDTLIDFINKIEP